MAQGRRRRRRWDDEEKRRIVAQTRAPGVSVSEIARRHDVNANMVLKWLRDPRFQASGEEAASFLPVEVIVEPRPPIIDVAPSDAKIEIMLANGHRLTVSGGFDAEAVSRLLRGLAS